MRRHPPAPPAALLKPVVIIGPMAAGKSFLGMWMADLFGYTFIDADQVIVSRHGSIQEIFIEQGEERFRELERQTICDLLGEHRLPPHDVHANAAGADSGALILSVGGGAPMNPAVAHALAQTVVVYLQTDLDTVLPRISGSFTRPMLRPDPRRRWSELYEQRRPTFERLADITLDVPGRPIHDIAIELNNRLLHWEENA
ncbi:hypothetical protein BKD30_05725 [Tersicoccus phoenicis]|uniref:Shikimate kinase n=1 Tax=Tersicoccus phoenicis TaxID=554083 RepID=A0A1R1LEW8_9MICC|nr:shikimate kinase [Tersicoccus phoenicis]OMH26064.1 hypothetical protein BKD30_05725 [Tersicoccus phoenicis]